MSVFVATCTVCARGKSLRQPAAGLLHPLPIPNHPWSQVALDSISSLPPSEGFTANLVVGDRFSKAAHFPSPNYHHRRAGGATCVLYPRPSPGHCVGSRSSLRSGKHLAPASAPLSACRLANPNPNQALEGIQRCYASKKLLILEPMSPENNTIHGQLCYQSSSLSRSVWLPVPPVPRDGEGYGGALVWVNRCQCT